MDDFHDPEGEAAPIERASHEPEVFVHPGGRMSADLVAMRLGYAPSETFAPVTHQDVVDILFHLIDCRLILPIITRDMMEAAIGAVCELFERNDLLRTEMTLKIALRLQQRGMLLERKEGKP